MKFVHMTIATFFGTGMLPGAPGTWGSLAAAPCFYFLLGRPFYHLASLVVIYFIGVYASGKAEEHLGQKDPSSVVIDEVLGMGVAMFLIPKLWPFAVMAFVLFRLFDIWKPYPIRRLEKLPGGWGIMTDDLMAGVYALVWMQIGIWLVHLIA